MALCARCGATVPDDAAHCVQCGQSMEAAAAAPDPAAGSKRTALGIATVDQKELERAIAAARAATAAGVPAQKAVRRTMMGVAAVKAPAVGQRQETLPDEEWGAPETAAPKGAGTPAPPTAPELDEGWELPEPVAAKPKLAPFAAAPRPARRPEAPTAPATPAAKTAMMESMAHVPGIATTPAKPVPQQPERSTDPGAGPPPVVIQSTPPAAGAPLVPVGPRGTVEMVSMAAPPPAVAKKVGPRETAVLAAMAEVPATPATKPITAPAPSASGAPATAVMAAAPTREEMQMADTLQGERSARELLGGSGEEAPAVAPLSGSSPDPLADTISPGSVRIDDILREMGASSKATTTGPRPAITASASTTGSRQATGPVATTSAASPTSTTSTGMRKAATTSHPPFLASKALAEDMHPTEPGRAEMRVIAIAGAVALGALWAAPLSLHPMTFAWSAVAGLTGFAKLLALYMPFAAVVLLALGVAKVPYRARAVGALLVGLIPLILAVGGLGPAPAARGWPGAVLTIGMVLLPGALIHRANYRASTLGRALVALGMLLVLAWMFVPGGANLIGTIFGGFGSARGLPQSIVMLAALVLVALSLLAFMPSSTTAGTAITGRLLLLVRPALLVGAAVADRSAGETPMALAVSAGMLLAFGVLASVGMAQSLASLEPPTPLSPRQRGRG